MKEKYLGINLEKKNNNTINSEYSNFIKIILILSFFLFLELFNLYILNLYYIRDEKIVESKECKNFNEIKEETNNSVILKILNRISIIEHIYKEDIEKEKSGKNIIHITVSINNKKNYKYILLVQMQSLLMACNKNTTFVVYHILCSSDFNELSTIIFKSLFNSFSHNLEIIFYNMGKISFRNRIIDRNSVTNYRLLVPLFINEDRIIHLDADCLVFVDLNEMYNLDFHDNYILGFYDVLVDGVDYLGINSSTYINAGITLLNLKKFRSEKICFDIIKLLNSNLKFIKADQTFLNYLLYPKIGRLPSKYGIFNFEDKSDLMLYLNLLRKKVPLDELEDALKNPGIVHFVLCSPKPWHPNSLYFKEYTNCSQRLNCSCSKYFNIWHSIAKETYYYRKIALFTGVNKMNLL